MILNEKASKTTKQRIIDEAIRCIAKVGFENTNARVIAANLKIRPSNVFYYFSKQPEIFEAAVFSIVEVNGQSVLQNMAKRKSKTNLDQLRAYISGNLEWSASNRDHVATLLVGFSSVTHSETIKNLMQTALQHGEDKVYNFLAVGVAEKEFSLSKDLRDVAKTIHQALTGSIIHMFVFKNTADLKGYEDRLNATLSSCIK